jgi:hypothetical protein
LPGFGRGVGDLVVRSGSIINFSAGQTVANVFVSPNGPGGSLLVYNDDASPVHRIIDVFDGSSGDDRAPTSKR